MFNHNHILPCEKDDSSGLASADRPKLDDYSQIDFELLNCGINRSEVHCAENSKFRKRRLER
jgi:hypothetical protein